MTQAEKDREAAAVYINSRMEPDKLHSWFWDIPFLAGIAHRDANPSDAVLAERKFAHDYKAHYDRVFSKSVVIPTEEYTEHCAAVRGLVEALEVMCNDDELDPYRECPSFDSAKRALAAYRKSLNRPEASKE